MSERFREAIGRCTSDGDERAIVRRSKECQKSHINECEVVVYVAVMEGGRDTEVSRRMRSTSQLADDAGQERRTLTHFCHPCGSRYCPINGLERHDPSFAFATYLCPVP